MHQQQQQQQQAQQDQSPKKWLEQRVHCTINPENSPGDFQILCHWIKRHPNYENWKYKIPATFRITRMSKTKYLQMFVKFQNGKRERIVSWRDCITGTKNSKVDPLTSAMRSAIRGQIREWRNLNSFNPKCVVCEISSKNLEVDHYPIPFRTLKKNFLRQQQTNEMDVKKETTWNCKTGAFQFRHHSVVEQQWKIYHHMHGKFRWLCGDCNKKYK